MPPEYPKENRFIINSLAGVLSGNAFNQDTNDFKDFSWDYVIATSDVNGVVPLITKSQNNQILPEDVIETFSEINRESAVSNLIKIKELLSINNNFRDNGIESLVLKGAGLGSDVYGDISLRPFGDLDILVSKEKLNKAVSILMEKGYEHIFNYTDKQAVLYKQSAFYLKDQDMHYSFYNPVKKINIELHWALMPGQYSFSQDVDEIFYNSVSVSHDMGNFKIPCDEDLIVYLSLHGSKHFWSRLIWIYDVAVFISKKNDVNWELVIARSEELNCQRMLLSTVCLSCKMFDVSLPNIIKKYLSGDRHAEALADQVLNNYSKIYDPEVMENENKRFFLSSMDSYYDKFLFVTGLIFKPTIYELEAVSLPNRLSFLYYLVRPLRLIKKYILSVFSHN